MNIKKLTCVLYILFLLGLTGCYTEHTPTEGNWFCEDLQIHVSFSTGVCHVTFDGQEIACCFENDRGSKYFSILVQETGVDNFPVGAIFFEAEHIKLHDNQWVVKENYTNTEYIFRKVSDTSK